MPVSSRTRVGVMAAAGVAALLAAAAPAIAEPVAPTPSVVTAGGAVQAADSASGAAGYVASVPNETRSSASTSIRVPSVACPARVADPLIVSARLSGQVSATDTTSAHATAGVTVTCTGGAPSYEAFVDTSTAQRTLTVSSADVLRISVITTPDATSLTLTNLSSGPSSSVTDSGFLATSFQVGAQGGFGAARFPRPLSPIRFATVALDNQDFRNSSPSRFDQTNAAGDTVLATSELGDRSAFSITFVRQP